MKLAFNQPDTTFENKILAKLKLPEVSGSRDGMEDGQDATAASNGLKFSDTEFTVATLVSRSSFFHRGTARASRGGV